MRKVRDKDELVAEEIVEAEHVRLVEGPRRVASSLAAVFHQTVDAAWTIWTAPLVDLPSNAAAEFAQTQAYLSYDDVGWFVFGTAGVGVALMAVPASLAAMRSGLPAWIGWLGILAGVTSTAAVAFFGLFAWMAWIVGASIVLLVARRG